jgi:hypothetical protein
MLALLLLLLLVVVMIEAQGMQVGCKTTKRGCGVPGPRA